MRAFLAKTTAPNGMLVGALLGGVMLVTIGHLSKANVPSQAGLDAPAVSQGLSASETPALKLDTTADKAPAVKPKLPVPTDTELKLDLPPKEAPTAQPEQAPAKPEVAKPVVEQPEVAKPEVAKPEVAKPKIAKPATAAKPKPAQKTAKAKRAKGESEDSGILGRAKRLANSIDNRIDRVFK